MSPIKIEPRVIILTGVAGVGKTTIGQRLAETLDWPYFDGDDYHPAANKKNGHFMAAEMLASQLAALEKPENVLTVDAAQTREKIVAQICLALGLAAGEDKNAV